MRGVYEIPSPYIVLPYLRLLYGLPESTRGNGAESSMPPIQDFRWYGPASTSIYDAEATEKSSGIPDIAVCSLDTPYPTL